MSTYTKQLIKLLLRIIITMILLAWVFSQIELQQFWQVAKTIKWQLLEAVWMLTIVNFWIQSVTLQFILKKQGCNVGIVTLFGASAVTSLYSFVLPGLLSTGVKWYIIRKNTGKGSSVLSSMLFNQLSLLVILVTLGLIALMITNPASVLFTDKENHWPLPVSCSILLAGMIIASWLILNNRTGSRIINALGFLLRPFPGKIQQKGREIIEQISIFQSAGARFYLTVASLNVINSLILGVFIYSLAARAAHIAVPAGVLLWMCVVVNLLRRLPISVASLGVREVTLVGVLGIYGVEKPAALLMSMILFSSSVLMALIGAAYHVYWAMKAKKSTKKGENRDQS
jgi:uncharacterized membrane protein YbhN (UPF0104 family)